MKRTEAMSPVIEVILMVALTVILASVTAAFVFGMADIGEEQIRENAVQYQVEHYQPVNCTCYLENLTFCREFIDSEQCLKIVCPECY